MAREAGRGEIKGPHRVHPLFFSMLYGKDISSEEELLNPSTAAQLQP